MALALALFAGLSACAQKKQYPEAPPYFPLPNGEFPISGSYAFYPWLMRDNEYKWVKEAGFNVIMQGLSADQTEENINMAKKYGLYVCVGVYGQSDTLKLKSVVDRFKDYSNVWGFSMVDEPNASKFGYIKKLNKDFEKYAPRQNPWYNLLPEMDAKVLGVPNYRDYVNDFVRIVNPPFLSCDIYPIRVDRKGNVYVTDVFYKTMGVISEIAKDSGRPLWSYILCNRHGIYPAPEEAYIRFQVFAALAYGVQGLRYFTYAVPDFDIGRFSDAPINMDGKRTKTWYMVRNVNQEVHALTKVFLGAEVVSVTFTGAHIPEGTERNFRVPAPFRLVESLGEGVMVSHLRNGDREYLLLVNRDVTRKQKVNLPRTRAVTRLFGDGTERSDNSRSLTLDPGGYALFRL